MQPHGAPTCPPKVPLEMSANVLESVLPLGAMPPPVMRQPGPCLARMCPCTHPPTPAASSSHPAVVQARPSVSVQTELSSLGVHWPVAGTQPRLHSSTVQSVFTLCVCRQCPTPAVSFSHPAVVHRLPSVSPHVVLSSLAVQSPVAGTQPRLHWSTVQSVFTLCVCRHCPTPAAFFSQPAVVHRLQS